METKIKVNWNGDFKTGTGTLNIDNSVLDHLEFGPIFAKGKKKLTNPEELLGSAHAACFNLNLSYVLSQAGLISESLETTVEITLQNNVITRSDLHLVARIPNIDKQAFNEIVSEAKELCAVGNVLKAEVTVTAELLD